MGYEFRNNTDPLTVIKQLRATSEKQSKHLAQALKEKNDLVAEHARHLTFVRADVDLWRDRSSKIKYQLDFLQKRYDCLQMSISSVFYQPPAPIVIESKALFEQNQSLQKEIELLQARVRVLESSVEIFQNDAKSVRVDNDLLRKQNGELTRRNENQITMVQRYRDEAGQLRFRISAALVQA